MKKILTLCLVFVFALSFGFANGSKESGASSSSKAKSGPVEVTWWTNFSGSRGKVLETLAEKYNSEQPDVHVTTIYQGSANEIIAKLQATIQKDALPDIFMNGNEQTSYFAEADFCLPLQRLVDEYGWDYSDTFSFLIPAYSNRLGELVGYPVGNSFTVVYVNMDIFNDAGIDPYTEVRSVEDMARVSEILVKGGYCEMGMGFHVYDGLPQIVLAVQGVDSFDNGNGYIGDVTKCLYDTGKTHDAMHNYMAALQKMAKDGTCFSYGTDLNAELIPFFASGKMAMLEATVSSFSRIQSAGFDFELGCLPTYGADHNTRSSGYPVAGTGNYLCDTGDEEREKAAFDFIKWLSLPENTAYVAANTGYIPVTKKGAVSELYQDFVKNEFPAMQVILDAQANGDDQSRFPYLPIANELFEPNRNMIQKVMTNTNADVDAAIHEACAAIDEAIEIYNATKK